MAGVEELSWQSGSVCAQTDPEAFFADDTTGRYTNAARDVCFDCDSQQECLIWALVNNEEFGLWGGLSEKERKEAVKELVTEQGLSFEDAARIAIYQKNLKRRAKVEHKAEVEAASKARKVARIATRFETRVQEPTSV